MHKMQEMIKRRASCTKRTERIICCNNISRTRIFSAICCKTKKSLTCKGHYLLPACLSPPSAWPVPNSVGLRVNKTPREPVQGQERHWDPLRCSHVCRRKWHCLCSTLLPPHVTVRTEWQWGTGSFREGSKLLMEMDPTVLKSCPQLPLSQPHSPDTSAASGPQQHLGQDESSNRRKTHAWKREKGGK